MNERVYNRLANLLILLVIVSALLFDSGKVSHLVAGTIGIAAGVGAIALYFWNQHKVQEAKQTVETEEAAVAAVPPTPPTPQEIGSSGPKQAIIATNALSWTLADHLLKDILAKALETERDVQAIESYRTKTARMWVSNYATHHARTLRWSVVKDGGRSLMQPEVELSATEVAACAIEIMNNLVVDGGRDWEYNFGPKGLRVSAKKAHSVLSMISQEDFDFEPASSSVQ